MAGSPRAPGGTVRDVAFVSECMKRQKLVRKGLKRLNKKTDTDDPAIHDLLQEGRELEDKLEMDNILNLPREIPQEDLGQAIRQLWARADSFAEAARAVPKRGRRR